MAVRSRNPHQGAGALDNTVAVRLGQEVGPKTVVDVAHRLGITSDLDPVPSIALGLQT